MRFSSPTINWLATTATETTMASTRSSGRGRNPWRGRGRRGFCENRPNDDSVFITGESHFRQVRETNSSFLQGLQGNFEYRRRGNSFSRAPQPHFRPRPPPPPKNDNYRYWRPAISPPPPHFERFIVVSFNILADYLARDHQPRLYFHIPPHILCWERRKDKILFELGLWNPDILCLQEVDRFQDLEEELNLRGYSGIWKMRTGLSVDGCAIFWRASRFALVHEEHIEFNKHDLRDNVAQICVLESRCQGNAGNGYGALPARFPLSKEANQVVVCNIHVLFNRNRGEIKLGQVRLLLNQAHAVSKIWNNAPVIICGDFNCTPKSPLYNFISDQKLDLSCLARNEVSGQPAPQFYAPASNSWVQSSSDKFLGECTSVGEEALCIKQNKDYNIRISDATAKGTQDDILEGNSDSPNPPAHFDPAKRIVENDGQQCGFDINAGNSRTLVSLSPMVTSLRYDDDSNAQSFEGTSNDQHSQLIIHIKNEKFSTKSELDITEDKAVPFFPTESMLRNDHIDEVIDEDTSSSREGTKYLSEEMLTTFDKEVSSCQDNFEDKREDATGQNSDEGTSMSGNNENMPEWTLEVESSKLSSENGEPMSCHNVCEPQGPSPLEGHVDQKNGEVNFEKKDGVLPSVEVLDDSFLSIDPGNSDVGKNNYDPYLWTPMEIEAASGNAECTLVEHHLKLKSAYTEVEDFSGTKDSNREPLVTSYNRRFMGTVDYIWHTESLQTVQVLDTLPKHVLRRTPGFPTPKWGSDHLALACQFAFTHDSESNEATLRDLLPKFDRKQEQADGSVHATKNQ